jgi:hypothetical protein
MLPIKLFVIGVLLLDFSAFPTRLAAAETAGNENAASDDPSEPPEPKVAPPMLHPKNVMQDTEKKQPSPFQSDEEGDDVEAFSPKKPNKKPRKGKKGNENYHSGPAPIGLSLLGQTPLIAQNTYDTRFATGGASALISIPLTEFSPDVYLALETGVGFTVSRLNQLSLGISFTHIYYALPVRIRLQCALGTSLSGEFLLGGQWRLFEYSSAPTVGGFGFSANLASQIDPEIAVGLSYLIASGVRLRGTAGYLYLAGGIEFEI